MLYELRTYDVMPGKSKALVDRFAEVALFHFKKHGLKPVLFLDPVIGTGGQLIYLLEWESLEARDKGWAAMQKDVEWAAARSESEKDGPLVARMTSSLLRDVPSITARARELWG